ncbi:site-2 protease. Metallo peptidase. MEROPS family M50B [Qipengyuania nanhaisediminis]|uniref:Zinc metalloprotease n=2 Tax=Qipengyuania nanhaisediminis TaxID=604088 RepID=A0A1I5NZK6_9SPHN|nr:site-2 protease. Metallo peptidase. MEROPS family M50B [Qipengyuania nanhaisediminis]
MDGSIPFWMYIIGFPLLLGPLVTLHELGHYLVGRWFGVHAEAFAVGFGKEIAGFTDKRGTRWKLCALPLGGYVQFKGDMNPASVPDKEAIANASAEEREGSFHHASLWKRSLIVFAGPAMNIIVTLAIFTSFFMIFGKPVSPDPAMETTITAFAEDSAAEEAGLEIGDRIVRVDGKEVASFFDLREAIIMYPGRTLDIEVIRDGDVRNFDVVPRTIKAEDRFGNVSTIGQIGIPPAVTERQFEGVGPGEAVNLSFVQTGKLVDMMVTGIKQIVVGERSVKELGGPVTIGKFAGEQLSLGALAFFNLAALISLNLAFINLLPIPALDGGHLAFYAAEAIRRKPLGPRSTEVAYRAGVALVLALMIFVTFIDIAKLPFFGN